MDRGASGIRIEACSSKDSRESEDPNGGREMKERYFTPENLAKVSDTMLHELYPSGQRRARRLQPEKSALLALDLQQYFLDPDSHAFVPSGPVILPGIRRLITGFLSQNRPVIATKHLNTEQNAGSLGEWWRDLITRDHPHQALEPSLDLSGVDLLEKAQYDAFYETDLENRLSVAGVKQVVVAGVMTHLCCETTARAAFVRGFEVFFLVDATASYRREHHMATLRNLGHGFATLVTTRQVQAAFEGHR